MEWLKDQMMIATEKKITCYTQIPRGGDRPCHGGHTGSFRRQREGGQEPVLWGFVRLNR